MAMGGAGIVGVVTLGSPNCLESMKDEEVQRSERSFGKFQNPWNYGLKYEVDFIHKRNSLHVG